MTAPAVSRSAVLSEDGRYRYRLDRWWREGLRLPLMMLNPSTADAEVDDPTIRRCMAFARRNGFAGITVVNIGAYRATNPKAWAAADDPFGPDNAHYVREATAAGAVVVAWGAHPMALAAAPRWLSEFARWGVATWCLGTTKTGAPRHPLYVAGAAPFQRYRS